MTKKAKQNEKVEQAQVEQAQAPERDPILDKTVSIELKVEELNVILNMLGELPYVKSSAAIQFLREKALVDLKAQEESE